MTDVRTEIEEETGLNLFEDKASAVGGFPHAMLGYDKQAVDSYIQDLEQRLLEMKVQLREQRRETSFVRAQVGTTDFAKLGAHARGLLEAGFRQLDSGMPVEVVVSLGEKAARGLVAGITGGDL